jgi:predicted component of type VI protein secretion system
LDAEGIMPCDIALRLSSTLKDPPSGFVFGRNKGRCDVVIGEHQVSKRISNVHFRIYINEYGVIMLEDQSTNGTAVDGTLLRGKDKENGKDYRHTLEQGSIITLTMTPPEIDYRFVVRIPQRDDNADEAYQCNLTAYFLRMNTVKINATGGKTAPENGKAEPVSSVLTFSR